VNRASRIFVAGGGTLTGAALIQRLRVDRRGCPGRGRRGRVVFAPTCPDGMPLEVLDSGLPHAPACELTRDVYKEV
jgi:hypothetical protein